MAIHKKIDGEDRVIANESVISHNQLSNRNEYGAHPISAIRKLPEKLHELKEKDAELERKLVEHDTEADKAIEDLKTQDAILKNKQDYIEKHSKQIDFNVNDNLEASFRNYDGGIKTFVTGYLPDEDTLTLNRDSKIALQKVYTDDKTIEGTGFNDYSALRIKYPADEDTIITDTENKNIYATAIRDDISKITPKHIRDKEEEYENRFGAVTNELKRQDSVDQYQKSLIDDLQTRTRGMGGWLDAYNFGKNPSQEDLTKYALQDIGIENQEDIWNGTRVRNLYNDDIWIWDSESKSWSNQGPDQKISDANNAGVHGLVTGSTEDYYASIDGQGRITINGVEEKDIELETRIEKHEKDVEEKFTHYVTLDTDQSIDSVKSFNKYIELKANHDVDLNVDIADNETFKIGQQGGQGVVSAQQLEVRTHDNKFHFGYIDGDGQYRQFIIADNPITDLGEHEHPFQDLYLSRNLTNGDKSISIEHIADIDDVQALSDIGLKYRGDFTSENPYDIYDVVKYDKYYFLSLLKNNVATPSLDNDTNWKCLNRHSINSEKVKVVEEVDTKAYLVNDSNVAANDYKELKRNTNVYIENNELYDKRGIVSSKEYVDEQIKTVISDSQEVNAQLRSDLDNEITNRETADNNLRTDLNKEINDRKAGDSTLQEALNQEIKDRQTGDESLQQNLDQEVQDRTEALEALEKKVNDEIQVKLNEQADKLDKEIQDRTDADSDLQSKLNKEIQDRTAADTETNTRIDNLKTSELENDGDGSSPFATQYYVDQYGGKIDSISVNGKENKLPIDEDKNVDITIPTKTSELTNDGDGEPDAKYATQEYVVNLVSTNTARYLTASADSDVMSAIFASFDAVKAGPWYRNGKETQPTNNDYATFEYHRMVEGSEIPQHEYWRAVYQVDHETGEGAWSVQSKLGSMLTMEQQKALDSGITSTLVSQITTNKNDIASLKTNLETNYYTKQETYSQAEVNELLKNVSAITIRRWA